MDYRALQAEILSGPKAEECAPFVHTDDMDADGKSRNKLSSEEAAQKDQAIADILSAGRTKLASKFVGQAEITHALYPDITGAAVFLYLLKKAAEAPLPDDPTEAQIVQSALASQAWDMVSAGTLDVGTGAARAAIDLFASVPHGILSPENAEKIKALAEVPDPVSAGDVSRAVRGPWD
jgi:hypothetical protein